MFTSDQKQRPSSPCSLAPELASQRSAQVLPANPLWPRPATKSVPVGLAPAASNHAPRVAPKLDIGAVDDPLESEAKSIAERVMRTVGSHRYGFADKHQLRAAHEALKWA